MKPAFRSIAISLVIMSCNNSANQQISRVGDLPIQGTWRLISGTTIEKSDTVFTSYASGKSFIKIINATHFAFLAHDSNKGKDSTAFFSSGGGSYQLKDSIYTEHLEYCNAREWEGNNFSFTINIINDTLVQQGREKIDSLGVDRINIERYVRLK